MALNNQLLVFEESIGGTSVITCPVVLNALLGETDLLLVQVSVLTSSSMGLFPTISATYYHSNDGQYFVQHTVLLSSQNIANPPYEFMCSVVGSAVPLGRFGRITIQLGGTSPTASIRVIACGRSGIG